MVQITGDYKKGYDRLCGGPALQEFIGWQHVGHGRDMSWLIGFEFNQAFTETRRSWDFSELKNWKANGWTCVLALNSPGRCLFIRAMQRKFIIEWDRLLVHALTIRYRYSDFRLDDPAGSDF